MSLAYLENLKLEKERLTNKLKRMIDGSQERATVALHLAGVNKEIDKLTPKPEPAAPVAAPEPAAPEPIVSEVAAAHATVAEAKPVSP